ncbi:Mss4-like protein [Venustampulla echinocandica]|uniref:Mss4-like protein n=1 Tax=Venustampulla echinocandica TaxID=2656787 RepID=A0A370TAI0_9HELO|nr:Mss4-like protein [Venustampulla echinocandica]RDL30813.1 Mss4-like protein [Venustampulla echinocandica]
MPSGSCLCGAINFEYTGEPAITAVCHCKDCQKWAGAAASTNVVVPHAQFKITKGTPKKHVSIPDSGKPYPRFFCGDCGTSLYGQPEGMDGLTVIKAGTLDNGAADIPMAAELYIKDRVSFMKPVDGALQKEMMP